jgi:hypothetical protein
VNSPGGNLDFPASCAMPVLRRIKTPGNKKPPPMVSPIGEWLPAAREADFCEPMAELMIPIDGENWFYVFCPVDQIDKVPAVLARLIGGAQ